MNASSQSDAQKRADEIRIFQKELARLEKDGALALSGEQRRAMADHHDQILSDFSKTFDIDQTEKAKQLSLGMRVASFLGAMALAASVFFLFYQFWGKFSEPAQVTILLIAALGTFAGTVWIRKIDPTGYFTKLSAMVAFACFVLNINMLGQIFNITPSDKALLPWAALAFLLAYAYDLRLLLSAGILCIIGYLSARAGAWDGVYWLYFGMRPENFFPAALVLFLVPQAVRHRRYPDFPPLYRIFSLLALFLPMLTLSHWGEGSYLEIDPKFIQHAYQALGFIVSAGLIWLGVRQRWSEVVNTAVTFFVIFLYTKFYDWWWELMPKYLFFFVLGLTAILFLLILRRLRTMGLLLAKGEGK